MSLHFLALNVTQRTINAIISAKIIRIRLIISVPILIEPSKMLFESTKIIDTHRGVNER